MVDGLNGKPTTVGQSRGDVAFSDDVMLRAMEFAEKARQPLDSVLNTLRGAALATG